MGGNSEREREREHKMVGGIGGCGGREGWGEEETVEVELVDVTVLS